MQNISLAIKHSNIPAEASERFQMSVLICTRLYTSAHVCTGAEKWAELSNTVTAEMHFAMLVHITQIVFLIRINA